MKMLERQYQAFCCAPNIFQGEMASYFFEQDQDRAIEEGINEYYPIYGDLEDEARKRGLINVESI